MPPIVRGVLAPVLAVGLLTLAAACDPDEAEPPRSGCAGLVVRAVEAVETDEQVELLDRALTVCPNYDAFAAQLVAAPGLIGYDIRTFVTLRCNERTPEVRLRTPACGGVPAPSTTTPVTATIADLAFVGVTLDGRRIEIRPSVDVPFVGDRPAVVKLNADIAAEAGCDGVLEQRASWTARTNDPRLSVDERDIASVFARHAWGVAVIIGCDVEPPPEPADRVG